MIIRSSRRSMLGRADLLNAIASGQDELIDAFARQLGLETQTLELSDWSVTDRTVLEIPAWTPAATQDSAQYPNQIEDVAFWLVTRYVQRSDVVFPNDVDKPPSYWRWTNPPTRPPCQQPLAPWSVIGARLRKSLEPQHRSRRIDLPRLIHLVAQRKLIRQVPRLKRRKWNTQLCVVKDRSSHLVPYFFDQDFVVEQLVRLLPPQCVSVLEGQSPFRLFGDGSKIQSDDELVPEQPVAGSQVLVLGDIGCLSNNRKTWHHWVRWARQATDRGCELMALVPCAVRRIPTQLQDLFAVQSWQIEATTEVKDEQHRQRLVEKILTLASPAVRLEPGLLRDLRSLLPEAAEVSLEADVWSSSLLSSNHPVAATIDRQIARRELRPKFESLPIALRRKALAVIRDWRKLLEDSPEVWFEEVLGLSDESRSVLPEHDLKDARAFWRDLDDSLTSNRGTAGLMEYADRFTRRASDYAMSDFEAGSILRKYQRLLNPDLGIHSATDPLEVPATDLIQQICIDADDQTLTLFQRRDSDPGNRHTALLHSSNGIFEIATPQQTTDSHFWKTGKPDFVSDYGTDPFGAWFEFQVPRRDGKGVVTQRMRWIRAGTFLMGSPQGERDRDSDETQHEVKLSRGYWLADTACTQELWEAVTGKTPSHFKGDRRPVERVSYDNVIKFVSALAKLVPDLSPALPTESQWEYACRAGTTTPFSFGDTINTDEVNFNGNYPYGNSPKGEYRQETVELKSLPSNCWGLYEMHGNVWEWCSDWFGEYSPEPQVDPAGPAQGSARVFRGGGWSNLARRVRSACRYWLGPGARDRDLGFRLLSSASAEPTEAAEVPVAEQGSEQTRFGVATTSPPLPWQGERAGVRGLVAKTMRVDEGTTAEVELSSLGPIRIRSNLEEVFLERMTKPKWAVAFGRDRFGTYYADFQVSSIEKGAPVRQRMRWIPPGRFRMGSPADEPGRYDSETQHDVTISSGFWMFDTPCTQALWLAVMPGANPSYFPDLTRPVEQLNWDHACQFAAKLTSKMPELSFSLPTEAQWEYACRAGTTTAIYTGPLEILGDANAPALDEIAWYGGNCGVDFELSNGQAVTWLRNKQYDFEKGGTRRVKQKRPNPWGLYDMLGNVWEWCQDWKGDYPSESQVDPIGPEMGSYRVVRGGSWSSNARLVRSACRRWDGPGFRYETLGFRLLSSASPDRNQRPNK